MSKDITTVKKNTGIAPRSVGSIVEDFFLDPWNFLQQSAMNTFRIDLKEDDKAYTVEAEMPGTKKEDITIDLDDGELTIGVAAKEKVDEDGRKLLQNERLYAYMERSVYLPDAAEEGVEAKLENGELIITIPKEPSTSPKKRIEIK